MEGNNKEEVLEEKKLEIDKLGNSELKEIISERPIFAGLLF